MRTAGVSTLALVLGLGGLVAVSVANATQAVAEDQGVIGGHVSLVPSSSYGDSRFIVSVLRLEEDLPVQFPVSYGIVEADGDYEVEPVTPGDYKIQFVDQLNEYAPQLSGDTAIWAQATSHHVSAGDVSATSRVDVTMHAGGSISGTVRGTDGNAVVLLPADHGSSAMVSVAASGGVHLPQLPGTASNGLVQPDGTYTYSGLPPGDYSVSFAAAGYQEKTRSGLVHVTVGESVTAVSETLLKIGETAISGAGKIPKLAQTIAGNVAKRVRRAHRQKLPTTTSAHQRIKWTSLTPRKCRVVGGDNVRGLRVGRCRLRATAAGTPSARELHRSFAITIRPDH